jgi:hypothetical protein
MRKWIGVGIISAASLISGGLWAHAQVQVVPDNPRTGPKQVPPPPQIISGADFGFRVESWAADGTPVGRFVVRHGGEWVEVRVPASTRRLRAN